MLEIVRVALLISWQGIGLCDVEGEAMLTPDEWTDELHAEGYSPATAKSYRWHLDHLLKFLNKDIGQIGPRDLKAYLAHQRHNGWGDATSKMAINAMQSFFARSVGKKRSPAAGLKAPRPKVKLHRTLSIEQAMNVMASCETSNAIGQRDLALICLLLDAGLRSAEVCALQLANVDLLERRLLARVKGDRWQSKVFSVYTAMQLRQWIVARERVARPETKTLFVSMGCNIGRPLTSNGLRVIFRRIGRRAGLERFSPHDMRRSFATLMIKFGASTRIVQVQGGWENLELLQRYTQALELADAEPFFPVGRLMNL